MYISRQISRQISVFAVLTFFDLHTVEKWGQVGFTALFVVGFFFLTWAGLAFCRHHAR